MSALASGQATPEGTRMRAREGSMGEAFYRNHEGLTVSTLGVGTYLGETDDAAREAYRSSIRQALEAGVTLVDTASNYREQASERDVGKALKSIEDRESVFLVTKGGFLHGDVDRGASVRRVVREVYVDEGLLKPQDVAGGSHSLAPTFLEHEVEASLENLGVGTLDLYLVHNPETQLKAGIDRDTVQDRLREAFVTLEKQRAKGRLMGYGVATWDALRVDPENPGHLGLEALLGLAQQAHEAIGEGDEHGFRGLQAPFNLAMPEALVRPTQPWEGKQVPLFEAADEAGLFVLASASLLQARLLGNVPPVVKETLEVDSDLEAALQFARSAPGVTTALVGMGSPEHVKENLAAVRDRPVDPEGVRDVMEATDGAPIQEAPR